MLCRVRAACVLAIAAGIVMASLGTAHADSDIRALSVSVGYAGFDAAGGAAHGGVIGLSHDRRLSDKVPLAWRVAITGGVHSADELMFTGTAVVGFSWLLSDTLKYVPYVLLDAGATVVAGKNIDTDVVPRVEFGLGMDLLKSRTFSYGIQVRAELESPFAVSQTGMLIFSGRATWRWGFF